MMDSELDCRSVSSDKQTLVPPIGSSPDPHITGWLQDIESFTEPSNQSSQDLQEIPKSDTINREFSFYTNIRRKVKARKLALIDIGPKAPLEPLPSLGYDVSIKTSQREPNLGEFKDEGNSNLQMEDAHSVRYTQDGQSSLKRAPNPPLPISTSFWIPGNGPLTLQSLREALFVHKIKSRLKDSGQWEIICSGRQERGGNEAMKNIQILTTGKESSSAELLSLASQPRNDLLNVASELDSSFRRTAGALVFSTLPEPFEAPLANRIFARPDDGNSEEVTGVDTLKTQQLLPQISTQTPFTPRQGDLAPQLGLDSAVTDGTELKNDLDEETVAFSPLLRSSPFQPMRLAFGSLLSTISNALCLVLDEYFPDETIPRDHIRIHWTCVCST